MVKPTNEVEALCKRTGQRVDYKKVHVDDILA
jgi:hypothetical protein